MRVGSDRQTLILAGEVTPPARADGALAVAVRPGIDTQLQRVTMLLVQGEYARGTPADPTPVKFRANSDSKPALLTSVEALEAQSVSGRSLLPTGAFRRGSSVGATEYERTQNLQPGGAKSQLIDTYA